MAWTPVEIKGDHSLMAHKGTPVLVGRHQETSRIASAIEQARSGKSAVALAGEVGVGKTALLHAARDAARLAGFSVAVARGQESVVLPPAFPLNQLLIAVAADLEASGAQLSDHLRSLLDSSHHSPAAGGLDAAWDVIRATRALDSAASTKPIALMVDDFQWVPREGRLLLLNTLRGMEGAVLFVSSSRTGVPLESEVLPDTSADLPIEVIEVREISREAVDELTTQVLGAPCLPSLLHEFHERSRGNPLFLLETIRSWRHEGILQLDAGGYWNYDRAGGNEDSRSLVDLVSSRLDGLDQNAMTVATALGVLGRPAQLAELEPLLEDYDATIEGLAALDDVGVVTREAASGLYQLTHPLVGTALLKSLSHTRRAIWHERLVGALQSSGRSSAGEIAFHAVRAVRPPKDLANLLFTAAQESEAAGAYVQAAEWYERLGAISTDDATTFLALTRRAAALEHVDPAEAEVLYGSALELAHTNEDRIQILMGRSRARRMQGHHDDALADLDAASTCAIGQRALEIKHAAAVVLGASGRTQAAKERLDSLSDVSKGTALHPKILVHLSLIAYVEGRLAEAIRLSKAAQKDTHDRELVEQIRMNLSWMLILLGRWKEAEEPLYEGIARARDAGDIWFLIPMLNSATRMAAWRGDFDRAMDHIAELVRLLRVSHTADRIHALDAIGTALLEKGDVTRALDFARDIPSLLEGAAETTDLGQSLATLCSIQLANGDLRDAADTLDLLKQTYLGFNSTWTIMAVRLDAELALVEGRIGDATAIAESALSRGVQLPLEEAKLHEILARALASERRDDARTHALHARAIYENLGATKRAHRASALVARVTPRRRGRPPSQKALGLTAREVEIVRLVAQGKTNRQIAAALTLSPLTVKKHIENVQSKAGTQRRTELAALAARLAKEAGSSESFDLDGPT
jgi:DNA-binding CsgD family transcriptional regulator